ncbi:DNA (cytosine-5)-methyltransferase 1 [Cognatiyoonia koreensis]|uniref:Cytosine-specific methyltransferase n=1 Tax=Cognatiyoonia koreensis TaxID=364200 RepID=A0A1I0N2T5_9RHOB|nr:DNA cytosine methyltransferase [Cognatiyoonia koreensis]SEV95057.1 DNA (cytosine-5)-methyltransferase 1 [Cognatiyoonia koreensis]
MHNKRFAEFFAGGGMVSAALPGWECVFANDIDAKKAASYRANHAHHRVFHQGDIAQIKGADIGATPNLIWGSFPCQDLSLAGAGAGLRGQRSGTYFEFWRIIDELADAGRAPEIVVIENVVGSLTSHGGRDFESICAAFARRGYQFGPMILDAKDFLPQSRPRLFVVGVKDVDVPASLKGGDQRVDARIIKATTGLSARTRKALIHWNLPAAQTRRRTVRQVIDPRPSDVVWHTQSQTDQLLSMMAPLHVEKVRNAAKRKAPAIGFVYKRTRHDADGRKVQRAEVRFDGVAGCLRTPGGGSSRQIVMVVDGGTIKSRLLSVREAARLMGLPERYKLPTNYNEGYHLIGDGVAVPVVRYLDQALFTPLLDQSAMMIAAE